MIPTVIKKPRITVESLEKYLREFLLEGFDEQLFKNIVEENNRARRKTHCDNLSFFVY